MTKILLPVVMLFLLSSFVYATHDFQMTKIECDGDIGRNESGDVVCVKCLQGTTFNGTTGECDFPDFVGSSSIAQPTGNSLLQIGGTFFPENPALGIFVILGVAVFIAWRFLKQA